MTDSDDATVSEVPATTAFDISNILNTPHMPRGAGEFAPALSRMMSKIPKGWGMWIEVGPGWYPIVTALDEAIAALHPDYEIHQVKEKYGTLRYYCSWDGEEQVRELIMEAEAKSRVTCEKCGAPGQLGEAEGWWRTTCVEHAPEGFTPESENDDPPTMRLGVTVQAADQSPGIVNVDIQFG